MIQFHKTLASYEKAMSLATRRGALVMPADNTARLCKGFMTINRSEPLLHYYPWWDGNHSPCEERLVSAAEYKALLKEAEKKGHTVIPSDSPIHLRVGFVVAETRQRFLTRLADLRNA